MANAQGTVASPPGYISNKKVIDFDPNIYFKPLAHNDPFAGLGSDTDRRVGG